MQQIKVWMYISAFNNEYGEESLKQTFEKDQGNS